MTWSQTASRRRGAVALALAVAAVGAAAAQPAGALAASKPAPDSRLIGTWVNTNPNSRNVKQIVIAPTPAAAPAGISVDMFGSCSPTLCEWGRAPAIVYGPSVSSTVGRQFQINIDQGFARRVDLGTLNVAATGALKLTVKELNTYTDGSGRHDWMQTETFVPAGAAATSSNATPASTYPAGLQPAPNANLIGTWNNVNPATKSIPRLVISTDASGHLLVHQYGACTPTWCDNGTVSGISYGTSTSSLTGNSFLAPYSFGFADQQLVATYTPSTGLLLVSEYTQFLDGSGRSNYALTEKFSKTA